MQITRVIYDLFIRSYGAAAAVMKPFSAKAQKWTEGRKDWQRRWQENLDRANPQRKLPVVWMHAASLGEYEQGLPLLEEIKRRWPATCMVVSFFSPSGMDHADVNSAVDVKQYLPADTKKNAHELVALLKPQLVLWVKYEYWFHHINAIHENNIPLFLISGVIQPHQPFFKWYGALHRQMLARFDRLFVQRAEDAALAKQLVPAKKIVVSGDTRFDRVLANTANPVQYPGIKKWLADFKHAVVAGSTWPGDEKLLANVADRFPYTAFLIVPHNVGPHDIKQSRSVFDNALLYSETLNNYADKAGTNVLIIDRVGMLRHLYALADVAFIGGGFTGDGVHNVPEAAAYGIPILHGPHYNKYKEAITLLQLGASAVVTNAGSLQKELTALMDAQEKARRGGQAKKFIEAGSGATQIIADYIQEKRLLTKE